MNPVKKGNEFENKVFKIVEKLVKKGDFMVSQKTGKTYQKKRYNLELTNSIIETDISVEVKYADAEKISMLLIVECKNHNSSIPIKMMQEFQAKLQDIAQLVKYNIKGIFVTNSALQSGALETAKKYNIGVIRILPENQINWLTYFTTSDMLSKNRTPKRTPNEVYSALQNQQYESNGEDFFAMDNKYIYYNFDSMLKEYLNS